MKRNKGGADSITLLPFQASVVKMKTNCLSPLSRLQYHMPKSLNLQYGKIFQTIQNCTPIKNQADLNMSRNPNLEKTYLIYKPDPKCNKS